MKSDEGGKGVTTELCPCGSGRSYDDCCMPCITGASPAVTPEQLMRSRYTAYVKGACDYLFETTHPDHRANYDHKGTEEWSRNARWLGLEIISAEGGVGEDTTATVEFIARYRERGIERQHHEQGHFLKDGGRWYFTEGEMVKNRPIVRTMPKIGRNDPCSCGSGLKYKKCCGR